MTTTFHLQISERMPLDAVIPERSYLSRRLPGGGGDDDDDHR